MSNPSQVPPGRGTQPRASEHADEVFREDANIYAENRQAGRHPHTEDEIEARIVASAADAAAAEGSEPLEVPLFRELIGVFRHRVSRDMPVSRAELVAGWADGQRARAKFETWSARREQGRRRRRELESVRERTSVPPGGTKFTRPEWLLACLVPAVAIELFGSIKALEAAFDLSRFEAIAFAIAISMVLVALADQLGNTLASVTSGSRRRAIGVLVALVVLAGGMGIWTLAALTESREVNTAIKTLGEREAESGSVSQGALSGKSPSAVVGALEKTSRAAQPEDAKPDLGFFVPLSVLVLLTSTLIAFRVEAAATWNDLDAAIRDAEGDTDVAETKIRKAEGRLAEATASQRETEYALAAHVDAEHGLLTVWIARFCSEYQRFCALEGRQPRELVMAEVPTAGEVMIEIQDRHRGDPPPRPADDGEPGSGRGRTRSHGRDRRPPDGAGAHDSGGQAREGAATAADRAPTSGGAGTESRERQAPGPRRRRARRPPGMAS